LPNSPKTSVSVWLDRISDRLGSLIPGGSHWQSRHPVKDSLVMALLRMITGWGTVGPMFLTAFLGSLMNCHPTRDHRWLCPILVPLPAFSVSGLLLIVPLSLWLERRRLLAACCLPFTIFSHYVFVIVLWFCDDMIFISEIEWNGLVLVALACLPTA